MKYEVSFCSNFLFAVIILLITSFPNKRWDSGRPFLLSCWYWVSLFFLISAFTRPSMTTELIQLCTIDRMAFLCIIEFKKVIDNFIDNCFYWLQEWSFWVFESFEQVQPWIILVQISRQHFLTCKAFKFSGLEYNSSFLVSYSLVVDFLTTSLIICKRAEESDSPVFFKLHQHW